ASTLEGSRRSTVLACWLEMFGNGYSIKGASLLLALTGVSSLLSSVHADSATVGHYACVAHRLVVQGKKGGRSVITVNPKPGHAVFSVTIAPIDYRDPETCKQRYREAGPYMQSWYCDTSFELRFAPRQAEPLRGDARDSFRGLLYSSFWLTKTLEYTYRYWETDESIRQMAFYWEEGRCEKK
ncbi:MAG: hypothetical protein R3268_07880, partial [Acidiferrobacterales bacterium]|nr:hypothetical protein [Acidiferrobacterales bacterium]